MEKRQVKSEVKENVESITNEQKSQVEISPQETSDKTNGVGIPVVVSLCLFISLASSLTTIFAYDRFYAQKMVAVDIRGYITEQRNAYVAGKITEEQLKGKFDELERVVTSIPKNKIVMMGDAVVRNVEVVKIQ